MKAHSYTKELIKYACPSFDYEDHSDIREEFNKQELKSRIIDNSIGAGLGISAVLNHLNINDQIFEAYLKQYPNEAANVDLYDKILEMDSPEALQGLVSGLKGKLFEMELIKHYENMYSGFDFDLAKSATQAGWDLIGRSNDGQEILVQVKIGSEQYASTIIEVMEKNPDIFFAVNSEIYDKISELKPELVDQLYNSGIQNSLYEESLRTDLDQLATNAGYDIPDSIADLSIGFVGLLAIGRILYKIYQTRGQYQDLPKDERKKMQTLKALIIIYRVVSSSAMYSVGFGIGSLGGPIGLALGGLSAFAMQKTFGAQLEQSLRSFILKQLNVTEDQAYANENHKRIMQLTDQFAQSTNALSNQLRLI